MKGDWFLMSVKRMALSLMTVAAVTAVVTTGTFALFTSSTVNSNNTFATGTVDLVKNSASMDLAVTDIAPGDHSGDANGHVQGVFKVDYTGSLDAWLGLDVAAAGNLLTCDGGGKFTFTISDGTNSYGAGANQVVAKVSTGTSTTFALDWKLDIAAGNDCQNKNATISMTAHAVQARNNTNGTGTGPNSWS